MKRNGQISIKVNTLLLRSVNEILDYYNVKTECYGVVHYNHYYFDENGKLRLTAGKLTISDIVEKAFQDYVEKNKDNIKVEK